MSEARTMSNSPALRATIAMISSGALPKVAFSSPPMASPVRNAICSVASTMRCAMGMIATQAEKKIHVCACGQTCSSATVMGTKMRSQLIVTSHSLPMAPMKWISGRYAVDQPCDASVDAASMRNARGDPARTNSSSYQFPPTEEKLIDQFRSFLAIPLLEPGRHDRQSMPIVFAQQHCLVLKSAGAELHASIVADRGEISNGLEVRQANLTVGRIQTADPPILQALPGGHHL